MKTRNAQYGKGVTRRGFFASLVTAAAASVARTVGELPSRPGFTAATTLRFMGGREEWWKLDPNTMYGRFGYDICSAYPKELL